MAYHELGEGALDYFACRYGASRLTFRGPRRRLDTDYVAVFGGTETYGKFVPSPYPALTEELIGMPVVNFGMINAGIDVFAQDETLMHAASNAVITVIQVLGAQNMTNRFFAVHPRRNDRFLAATNMLRTIYRNVDFTEFNFTRHLLAHLFSEDPARFEMVAEELRQAWVARMKTLVSTIKSPVVLLWLSDHAPEEVLRTADEWSEPLFVDRDMLSQVAPYTSGIVEITAAPSEIADGFQGLAYNPMEANAAREMLGVVAHERAARGLHAELAERIGAIRW